MKPVFASLAGAIALAVAAHGEVRRALVVGIDKYLDPAARSDYRPSANTLARLRSIHGKPSRGTPSPLDGGVNDAEAIRELLIARFGFKESDIVMLKNGEATADRILGLLQSHLIDAARPGDVSFFFFAGHGSRIRNTSPRNTNASGYDSTIVPADAALGVPDIRSKELAKIYLQAPAKGVSLTVIQDSCYSGAASRGALAARKVRAQPADAEVSVDEAIEGSLPEDRGVLFISAAQDYEPAAELDETDLNGSHGAFTWALLHVLGASSSDDGVDRIFQRVRALMQSKISEQEPVLLAKDGRNARGLFGQAANLREPATVAVARVAGPVIRLNGGLAANLHEGCELKRVSRSLPEVAIRITKVNGLASSEAVVSRRGTEDAVVRPGDLFEIEKWVAPDRELLRVSTGTAVPEPELKRMSGIAAELKKLTSIHWIDDPTAEPPTHILNWNAASSRWTLRENHAGAKEAPIGPLTAHEIARRLPASSTLFVDVGPSQDLLSSLRFQGNAILTVEAPEHADYALLGRFCGVDCIEYAWGNPSANGDRKSARSPLRTDWFAASLAEKLNATAHQLAKIVGWLNLAAPDFNSEWPYRLALQNAKTKELASTPEVRIGERYKLMLRAAPDAPRGEIPSRRVYVFAVDSFGESQLLFGDNLENEFPRMGQTGAPGMIPLTAADFDFEVGLPYGVDNFFLFTSEKPIDNPETVFNSGGVRTRSAMHDSPLARLLERTATGTRGAVGGIPTDWSIEHVALITVRGESK